MRAEGRPSVSHVASVIAFGSGTPAPRASANHCVNCANGSGDTSRSSSEARLYSVRSPARSVLCMLGEARRHRALESILRLHRPRLLRELLLVRGSDLAWQAFGADVVDRF